MDEPLEPVSDSWSVSFAAIHTALGMEVPDILR